MAAASTIRTARSDEMMRWIENAQTAFEATGRTIINHNHQMVREYNFQRAEIEKMTRHRVRLSEAVNVTEPGRRIADGVSAEWTIAPGGVNKSRPPLSGVRGGELMPRGRRGGFVVIGHAAGTGINIIESPLGGEAGEFT